MSLYLLWAYYYLGLVGFNLVGESLEGNGMERGRVFY
jgi:hypothetical protein